METTVKKKKSALRRFISAFLGVLFIIFVVCGIIVATYVFSTPSKDGESRQFIMGDWIDDEDKIKFVFSENGDFYMYDTSDGEKTLAKGYFKVKEDDHVIKLLILPSERSDNINFGLSLYFFSTLSYTDLKYPSDEVIEKRKKHDNATCKLLFQNADGKVYKCERHGEKTNFYGEKISSK